MKYSRFAVIGSNSFAGSAFVSHALGKDSYVLGINRSVENSDIFLPYKGNAYKSNYRFIQADINLDLAKISKELSEFQPEIIVDLAGQGMVAESWENPEQWYQTNIVSKVRLHEFLRKQKWMKKYIRVSTPEVYGSQDDLLNETFNYNPTTPYAVSHASVDMSLKAYFNHYGFPVIFTRFANFYGPGQQLYRIVPRTIIYGFLGKKLQLHGGGKSIRAFIHASDIAGALACAIDGGTPGSIYHFSPREFQTIRMVVENICSKMNIDFNCLCEVSEDRPGKDFAYLMSSEKARNELGWNDEVSFDEGIVQTIAWIKENIEEIRLLPLNYVHKI